MAPIGLYARLCHAFLVFTVFYQRFLLKYLMLFFNCCDFKLLLLSVLAYIVFKIRS